MPTDYRKITERARFLPYKMHHCSLQKQGRCLENSLVCSRQKGAGGLFQRPSNSEKVLQHSCINTSNQQEKVYLVLQSSFLANFMPICQKLNRCKNLDLVKEAFFSATEWPFPTKCSVEHLKKAPFTRQRLFGAAWMKVVRVPRKQY